MTEYVNPAVLVSTQWVADHLNDPTLRIVESNEDILLYEQGHIPGAVMIDWQLDLNDSVRRDYLKKGRVRGAARVEGHRQRHHRRLLRRQEQLVGVLCLLGLSALRPRQRADHERRAQEVGRRGPAP
jgi:3-mercaptopyruvate sulfurtransferase SseA